MDDFFDNEQKPPVAVQAKKRKRAEPKEKNEELEQLKQEARVLATCPEQWKTLSRYNHEKLKEWVLNERFRRDQLLYDTVYSFIQKKSGISDRQGLWWRWLRVRADPCRCHARRMY